MKKNTFATSIIIFLLLFLALDSQVIKDGIGYIPTSNQLDWHKAGLENTTPTTAVYTINVLDFGATPELSSNDDTDAFKQAIIHAGAKDGLCVIYIPEGYYTISEQLTINNSNCLNGIVFRGEGADKTSLLFQLSSTIKCFYVHGDYDEQGNWIKKIEYRNKIPSLIYERNVIYF